MIVRLLKTISKYNFLLIYIMFTFRAPRSLNHSISPMQQSPLNNKNPSINPSPSGSISRGLQRTPHGSSPASTPVFLSVFLFTRLQSYDNLKDSKVKKKTLKT